VFAAFAAVRLAVDPALHFGTSAAWRYWADALEIADAHRIPAEVLQYGQVFPAVVNKVFLNALNAGVAYGAGTGAPGALAGLGATLWVGAVGSFAALWALGHELGLRLTAPLLPLLAFADRVVLNTETTTDLDTFKAEIGGRLLAFAGAALLVRALRRSWERSGDPDAERVRGRRDAAVGGALIGLAAAVHAVPVLIVLPFLAWYAAAGVARRRLARPVLGRAVRVAVTGGLVAAAVAAVLLVLPRGDLGLGLRGPGGNEASEFGPGFDPTRYLNAGTLPGEQEVGPDTWYIPPGRALREYTASALAVRAGSLPRLLPPALFAAGLLVALAMAWRFPARLRPLGVAAWGLGATIVGLTWFFSARYDFYIPSFFGVRRLFDYSSLPLALGGAAVLEGGLALLGRRRPRPTVIAGAVAVVAVAAVLLPTALPGRAGGTRLAAFDEAFAWIRGHTPCDARLLADQHTEGAFEVNTGRVAILEGATPYLRPEILNAIVRLHLLAREFFQLPPAGGRVLIGLRATHVIDVKAGGIGYSEPIGPVDRQELPDAGFLRLVYESPVMDVYAVEAPEGAPGMPRQAAPREFPGYACPVTAQTGP